jgi:hypothetical protein
MSDMIDIDGSSELDMELIIIDPRYCGFLLGTRVSRYHISDDERDGEGFIEGGLFEKIKHLDSLIREKELEIISIHDREWGDRTLIGFHSSEVEQFRCSTCEEKPGVLLIDDEAILVRYHTRDLISVLIDRDRIFTREVSRPEIRIHEDILIISRPIETIIIRSEIVKSLGVGEGGNRCPIIHHEGIDPIRHIDMVSTVSDLEGVGGGGEDIEGAFDKYLTGSRRGDEFRIPTGSSARDDDIFSDELAIVAIPCRCDGSRIGCGDRS